MSSSHSVCEMSSSYLLNNKGGTDFVCAPERQTCSFQRRIFSSACSRLRPNEEEWDARFSVSDRERRKNRVISL